MTSTQPMKAYLGTSDFLTKPSSCRFLSYFHLASFQRRVDMGTSCGPQGYAFILFQGQMLVLVQSPWMMYLYCVNISFSLVILGLKGQSVLYFTSDLTFSFLTVLNVQTLMQRPGAMVNYPLNVATGLTYLFLTCLQSYIAISSGKIMTLSGAAFLRSSKS